MHLFPIYPIFPLTYQSHLINKTDKSFTIYLHYIRLQIYSNQLQKRRFHKPFRIARHKRKTDFVALKEYS
ncbi:hypothetical protein F7O43_01480 [Neisseria meningitidis]|uniref:Uncharacterized protein n=1 Tax=Neisseria meningitidis serogroup B (strain ATCC BAA-335 / MC58) TaxID=122586 RepID=Q9K031_NEIMB|nr:hypothetical protein NMB0793 [Neisseria meningitidis MC58]ARC08112.1 hypothetical protein A6J49_08360 [Neisseria meningitidis]ARC13236.1 hypothetical protein A6J51_12480 [Neisseria meningitidis]MBG8579744.1 hypothetical protein [Neisseria meningitidis]MBG8588481.1 hypothetical protein [Neisseria meningitidis]